MKDAQILLGVAAIVFRGGVWDQPDIFTLGHATNPRRFNVPSKDFEAGTTETQHIGKTIAVCLAILWLFGLSCILKAYIIVGVPLVRRLSRKPWGLMALWRNLRS
jgi:hypothetical protein